MGLFLVDLIVAFLSIEAVNTSLNMKIILNISLLLLLASVGSAADNPKNDSQKTKIDQFLAKHGSLILKASSETIGKFDKKDFEFPYMHESVTFHVVELIAPQDEGKEIRQYGLQFDFLGNGSIVRDSYFLDEDEIDSFCMGIDYLMSLDPKVSKIGSVKGVYKTKAGINVQTIKDSKVETYAIGAAREFSKVSEVSVITRFRKNLVEAQAKIDEIKKD
mgnify:CR=1 FL=1